jgi:hypothetical protein
MNPVPLPASGLHYGVPFEEYQRWPAVNFSTLKEFRGTASKGKWAMEHPKEQSPAMILGSALHIATLEPSRFEQMFHICPPCDRRTKEGKDFYAQETLKAEGKILIRQGGDDSDKGAMGEVECVRGMAAAIHASKAAALFVDGAGQNEVSMLWKDAETGLMCKARMDRLIPEFAKFGCPVVVELKSARDADDWGFAKDVEMRGYHIQAASYCHGYQVITGKRPAHVIIAVENFPPHDLKVHMLDDAAMATGLLKYRELLNRYAECVKSGNWPGYADKINELQLPKWAN